MKLLPPLFMQLMNKAKKLKASAENKQKFPQFGLFIEIVYSFDCYIEIAFKLTLRSEIISLMRAS